MTGVPSPSTIFNVELSPKTVLKNHYEWIYSSMDLMEGKKIICDTTEKNSLFERTDGLGVTIKEKEDITINAATLGQKMFRPYFINFSAMSSLNLLEQMTVSNGLGYFKIGNFKGFPIDIKTNDATLETQDYKLLMTPDNDLTTLIKR